MPQTISIFLSLNVRYHTHACQGDSLTSTTEWLTKVIPLIVHITLIITKAFDIWYRINPHRQNKCS